MSAHSVAEVYAVLTRIPIRSPLSPSEVWRIIHRALIDVPSCKISALTSEQYTDLIHRLSNAGHGGGIVYDAIIAEVARVQAVDHLITLNARHFARLVNHPTLVQSPLDYQPNQS